MISFGTSIRNKTSELASCSPPGSGAYPYQQKYALPIHRQFIDRPISKGGVSSWGTK